MLLTKEVEVKPTGKMIKHYRELGYDAKHTQPLMVKVKDLSRSSSIRVNVICDYCGDECNPRYIDYCNSIDIDGTYACCNCGYLKAQKTIYEKYGVLNYSSTQECREKVANTLMSRYGVNHVSQSKEFLDRKRANNKEKYGVEYTLQVKEFRDKGIQTNLEKYGVEHASQCEEIQRRIRNAIEQKYGVPYASQSQEVKDRIAQTNLSKYGYECVLSSPDIQKKVSNTIKEIYGVNNISQSDEIKNRKAQTMLEHYGVEYPSLSNEILEKRRKTFFKNGTTPTSKQQLYVFNLYNKNRDAYLNYPISSFGADICFPEVKLDIEIDCGGHNLRVKMGQLTQEEFDHKELVRDKVIKKEGYKIIRIKSKTDLLPSDVILLQMLEEAKDYFSNYPNHSWVEFNIDASIVRNAEHKDGTPYDFGELRKISSADVDVHNVA